MSRIRDKDIAYAARQEVDNELIRQRIDAEKVRIYEGLNRSFWSRFLAWLPFTITWKK